MKLLDLHIYIENIRGSYKHFADTPEEYPVLGVTFPTHYGYIPGYKSEDGHDLDVFLGSGAIHGIIRVNRKFGIETKTILYVSQDEFDSIKKAYEPVTVELKTLEETEMLSILEKFKS